VAQQANLSFKNKLFLYISVKDKASDFKFRNLLRFANVPHQISLEEKEGVALG